MNNRENEFDAAGADLLLREAHDVYFAFDPDDGIFTVKMNALDHTQYPGRRKLEMALSGVKSIKAFHWMVRDPYFHDIESGGVITGYSKEKAPLSLKEIQELCHADNGSYIRDMAFFNEASEKEPHKHHLAGKPNFTWGTSRDTPPREVVLPFKSRNLEHKADQLVIFRIGFTEVKFLHDTGDEIDFPTALKQAYDWWEMASFRPSITAKHCWSWPVFLPYLELPKLDDVPDPGPHSCATYLKKAKDAARRIDECPPLGPQRRWWEKIFPKPSWGKADPSILQGYILHNLGMAHAFCGFYEDACVLHALSDYYQGVSCDDFLWVESDLYHENVADCMLANGDYTHAPKLSWLIGGKWIRDDIWKMSACAAKARGDTEFLQKLKRLAENALEEEPEKEEPKENQPAPKMPDKPVGFTYPEGMLKLLTPLRERGGVIKERQLFSEIRNWLSCFTSLEGQAQALELAVEVTLGSIPDKRFEKWINWLDDPMLRASAWTGMARGKHRQIKNMPDTIYYSDIRWSWIYRLA